MIGKRLFFRLSLSLGLSLTLGPGLARAGAVTLQEGLAAITSQGYEMRIAMARESAATSSRDQAMARLRPQVNAYADHTWLQNQPEAIFGGGTSPLGDDRFLRYGVTVRQLITDFGRTGSGIEAARARTRAQSVETMRTRNNVALDFVTSYVSLLRAEKALTLADLEVTRFESHLSDARALHTAGEVTLNDVLAAEVVLADARLRRITIRDERNLAATRLNYLMLSPLDRQTDVADFGYYLDQPPDLERALTAARSERPELKILDETIAAKEAELGSRDAESYPSMYISGGYAFEENSYRVHEGNWSATVGITWELYTGGARTAEQKKVMEELEALVTQRQQLKELVDLEVRDAHRLLAGAVEGTLVTQKAVTQAQESLRLQRSRYTEGEATATEVTDAVTLLARAENNYWKAVYERLQAEARLLYASGEDLVAVYTGSANTEPSDKGAGEVK